MTPTQRAEAALTELQRLGQEYDQALADGCDVRRLAEAIKARALDAWVKVKPLEWKDHKDKVPIVLSRADTLLGTYFICDDTDDFTGLYLELISHDDARWWQHVRSTSETIMENYHGDDLNPIKAAAQADYERRILSALEAAS